MSAVPNERRYGGKTSEERREERRERLLDAGLELFGTRGYAATSIEAICGEARLNARYFYETYETRESLLGAVYDRHVEAVFGAVLAAVAAAPPDPVVQLRKGLAAFVELTLADPRATRINYFEMVGVSAALEGRRRVVLRRYADMIAAQIQTILGPASAPPGGDLHRVAVALVAATDGLIIDLLGADGAGEIDAPERDGIIATLVAIFAAALLPRA